MTTANNKRLPDRTDRGTRFERDKESLKESAAALDRDEIITKRTEVQTIKKKTSIISSKNRLSVLPNPQPQISTPVPSSNNDKKQTSKKQDQRVSTMSDAQIMERLRKYFFLKKKI